MTTKKHKPGWYVVVCEYDKKPDDEVKRLGPYASERLADKADGGMNRNIRHETYFTRIEHVKS